MVLQEDPLRLCHVFPPHGAAAFTGRKRKEEARLSNLAITNEHNKTVAGKEVVPLYGVSTSSEPIKCPGQIEREREQGGGGKGVLQVDDVDEAAISPSKCNKEE